ncbi:cytochrome P450 [Nevskia sp.]|uniref:cytochrome P450 n=1 Tax=Nevskia sp. TaxID=1929292 RepID=UPI0025E1D690|nr:cytochrome P450 [Nevskia sp.]
MTLTINPRDLATPAIIADPYPAYDALRADSPVAGYADWPPGTVPGQDAPLQAWALLKHEHVLAAARDPQTFSSANFQQGTGAPTLMLVNHDDPEHAGLRKLVSLAFTPRRIRELRPDIEAVVKDLLDALPEGEIDVVSQICAHLPARLMLRLLGLPPAMSEKFQLWSNAFMLSAAMTAEERNASNVEMVGYFQQTVSERAARLASGAAANDDLIDALLTAEADGKRLSHDEVWRFCFTLVVAGSETTMYYATNCLQVLISRPELYEKLQADRTLIGRFQSETLRRTGPPQRLFRKVMKDVEIGGKAIKAGEWVALFFAAANHDPAVFAEPYEFRLDRTNASGQLSFGHGIHYCLGAPLANLEVECLLNAVLDRYAGLQPGSSPAIPQTATLLQHSHTSIPARLVKRRSKLEEANIAQVKEVFVRFGSGNVPAILELLDDEVRIEFYGPSTIPYAGDYRSRKEAGRFFETVLASVDIHQFDAEEFIAQNDQVIVTGHLRLTAKATGGTIESDFVHVITLRDGRWLRFRDFMNTSVAVAAFTPH